MTLPAGSDDRDQRYMEWEGYSPTYTVFDEINWMKLNEAFLQIGRGFQEWAQKISRTMNIWFPIISEAHRAEVKRVHTQYDRKRRARKRRK